MHRYKWIGITISGTQLDGVIDAKTQENARHQLRQQHIIVRKITKQKHSRSRLSNKQIKNRLRLLFTQQLSILIDAGISLSLACDVLNANQNHSKVKQSIAFIKKDIEMGCMLSESLLKQPLFFNQFFCNVIKIGEHSGTLAIILRKLAQYEQLNTAIKKKITRMLAYPCTVVGIGIMITILLLTTVIPQFEALFANFGAKLPLITRFIIQISHNLSSYWFYIICFIVSIGTGLHYIYRQSPQLVQRVDTMIITLPLLGKLVKYQSIARFSRLLSLLFTAGLPLTDALRLVADATGNRLYQEAIHTIQQDISKGESIKQAIIQTRLFPHLVGQMIGIGEESGSLDVMLNHIANLYEEEINTIIEMTSLFLEPAIMALLGFIVGILVVAMYLPIITLGTVI